MKGGLSEAQAGCTIWKDTEKRNPAMKPKKVERNSFTDRGLPSTSSGIRRWDKVEEISEVPAVEESTVYEEVAVAAEEYIDEPVAYEEVAAAAEEYIDEPVAYEDEVAAAPSDPPPVAEPEPSPVIRTIREKYPEPPSPKRLTTDFSSLSYPLLAPRNNYDSTCEPVEEFEPDQCYSNVFLAHASLYILGDYRLIDSLKALALYKLHKTLCIFQLNNENVEDIINLARYAYSAEGKGFEEGIGELRGMVCRYMAENAVALAYENRFMDLLGEGGEFVKDFFKFELQMIH